MGGLVADLDAGTSRSDGQTSRYRRHGPHRAGGGAARQGVSVCRSTITIGARSRQTWRNPRSRRPTGRAWIRCWPAWTSSPSTARTRPATYHLLSARRLKLLKPTAYIVNTARGEVIDENAHGKRMIESGEGVRRRRPRRVRARAGRESEVARRAIMSSCCRT